MQKYTYILTGIADFSILKKEELKIAEIYLGKIGIKIRKIYIVKDKKKKNGLFLGSEKRFAFTIGNGIKDDILAQKFADGTMLGIALAHETCLQEIPAAIAVKEELIDKKRCIKFNNIIGNDETEIETYYKLNESNGGS
ncbi:MAG: hypothetical protein JW740_03515 [Candidatus Zambryskibacteria bacterium]|nr:hypothetical protein [Candidatus Zambryskibacteria bacterium]